MLGKHNTITAYVCMLYACPAHVLCICYDRIRIYDIKTTLYYSSAAIRCIACLNHAFQAKKNIRLKTDLNHHYFFCPIVCTSCIIFCLSMAGFCSTFFLLWLCICQICQAYQYLSILLAFKYLMV